MYQRLIIAGYCGKDPEQRFTSDGNPVTSFSVATSRKFGDKDETVWWRVTVWGKQAESTYQYLKKGAKVLVEGRLTPDDKGGPRVFERKDGTWGASYDVVAESVRFLSGKADAPESEEAW